MSELRDIIDGGQLAIVFNQEMEKNYDNDRHWGDLAVFLEEDQKDPKVVNNTKDLIIYIFEDKFALSVPWFINFSYTLKDTTGKEVKYKKEFDTFIINAPKAPPHPEKSHIVGETQTGW